VDLCNWIKAYPRPLRAILFKGKVSFT
jgi:hypothetical protein